MAGKGDVIQPHMMTEVRNAVTDLKQMTGVESAIRKCFRQGRCDQCKGKFSHWSCGELRLSAEMTGVLISHPKPGALHLPPTVCLGQRPGSPLSPVTLE